MHAGQTFLAHAHPGPGRGAESVLPKSRSCLPPRIEASLVTPMPQLHGSQEVAQLSEYSQRRSLASTTGPDQNPLLSLSHPKYTLPQRLVSNFESLGVRSIYPWQSSCLLGKALLSGETSLIYTAPTGGGKSGGRCAGIEENN
jgi:hypothetical protein